MQYISLVSFFHSLFWHQPIRISTGSDFAFFRIFGREKKDFCQRVIKIPDCYDKVILKR